LPAPARLSSAVEAAGQTRPAKARAFMSQHVYLDVDRCDMYAQRSSAAVGMFKQVFRSAGGVQHPGPGCSKQGRDMTDPVHNITGTSEKVIRNRSRGLAYLLLADVAPLATCWPC
jgi:hypothetical protein